MNPSPANETAAPADPAARSARSILRSRLVAAGAAIFLLLNAAVRGQALIAGLGAARGGLLLAVAALGFALLRVRPTLTGPALELFGASFLLYGFHAYRLPSQALELLVTVLALALLARRTRGTFDAAAGSWSFRVLALFAALATTSLLLLPPRVLAHRLFLEGNEFGRAVVEAFPKDPLYPIASVDRLWLFVLFAALLASQDDARELHRRLFRGIAWAAALAAVLGLLDFAGLLPLDRYNLANLFYGRRYRRLQSTFGNPSWFACFVACALPFVLLRLHAARGWARWAMAVVLPLCAAALFLSAARAAWLAALVVGAGVLLAAVAARRSAPRPAGADGAAWLAYAATVATVAILAAGAAATSAARIAPTAPVGRLEGLSREMQYRGIGTNSPRRLAAAYARELAAQAPVLGLGYESYNLHLRAQLAVAGSGIARAAAASAVADPAETVFDDSHSTYLQVLTGTGAAGLALWLAAAGAGLALAVRTVRHGGGDEALAVLGGLVVFHLYGLFQGMAYIPVSFLLLPLLTSYAVALDGRAAAPASSRKRLGVVAAVGMLLGAATLYAADSGYAGVKRRLGVTAYLPDEAEPFEGFYRPETGPDGEFRWMRRRAIVNVDRPGPFRLRFDCPHADADRDPVVLSLRFEGRDAGQIVFRRPGAVEQRFDLGRPGALRLKVSRTFRPAEDARELGVAVSAIRWE